MKRQEARQLMMQLIFQMEAQKDFGQELCESFLEKSIKSDDEQRKYADRVISAFIENREAIDAAIEEASVKWHIRRMAKVDLAVLRLAVTELRYLDDEDIPLQVAINEAVNLAKKFGAEESGKFVNGILGKIAG